MDDFTGESCDALQGLTARHLASICAVPSASTRSSPRVSGPCAMKRAWGLCPVVRACCSAMGCGAGARPLPFQSNVIIAGQSTYDLSAPGCVAPVRVHCAGAGGPPSMLGARAVQARKVRHGIKIMGGAGASNGLAGGTSSGGIAAGTHNSRLHCYNDYTLWYPGLVW